MSNALIGANNAESCVNDAEDETVPFTEVDESFDPFECGEGPVLVELDELRDDIPVVDDEDDRSVVLTPLDDDAEPIAPALLLTCSLEEDEETIPVELLVISSLEDDDGSITPVELLVTSSLDDVSVIALLLLEEES